MRFSANPASSLPSDYSPRSAPSELEGISAMACAVGGSDMFGLHDMPAIFGITNERTKLVYLAARAQAFFAGERLMASKHRSGTKAAGSVSKRRSLRRRAS